MPAQGNSAKISKKAETGNHYDYSFRLKAVLNLAQWNMPVSRNREETSQACLKSQSP
jgi:hypothetical protein